MQISIKIFRDGKSYAESQDYESNAYYEDLKEDLKRAFQEVLEKHTKRLDRKVSYPESHSGHLKQV